MEVHADTIKHALEMFELHNGKTLTALDFRFCSPRRNALTNYEPQWIAGIHQNKINGFAKT